MKLISLMGNVSKQVNIWMWDDTVILGVSGGCDRNFRSRAKSLKY